MGGILSVIHIQNWEFWVFCSGHEATGTLVTSDAKRWERAHEKKRLTTYKIDIISTVFWMAKPLLRIMLFLPVPSTRGVIFDKNLSRLLLRYHIHWSKKYADRGHDAEDEVERAPCCMFQPWTSAAAITGPVEGESLWLFAEHARRQQPKASQHIPTNKSAFPALKVVPESVADTFNMSGGLLALLWSTLSLSEPQSMYLR